MHSSIKSLASIQREAALMITGALGSTANDVIDSMANLLPFYLLVENYRYRAALRLAMIGLKIEAAVAVHVVVTPKLEMKASCTSLLQIHLPASIEFSWQRMLPFCSFLAAKK